MLYQLSYTHHRLVSSSSIVYVAGPRRAPEGIRTPDPRLRRPLLYPPELLAPGRWSGRDDLNVRPPAPKAGALPGCATPRHLMAAASLTRLPRDRRNGCHASCAPSAPASPRARWRQRASSRPPWQLGEGAAGSVGDEHRIVAEAAAARAAPRRSAPRSVPRPRSTRPSGHASTTAQRKRAPRRVSSTAAERAQQPCAPVPRRRRREARRAHAGAPASASTSRPESSASAGRPVAAATARAFTRRCSRYVAPVFVRQPDDRARRRRASGRRSTPHSPTQRAQLARSCRVGGREHQPRRDHRPCEASHARGPEGARAGAAISWAIALASQTREHALELRGAVKARPSAVPCTSTKRPPPVMTRFMSTSARLSSA